MASRVPGGRALGFAEARPIPIHHTAQLTSRHACHHITRRYPAAATPPSLPLFASCSTGQEPRAAGVGSSDDNR
jgi:hypothetical protein